ncbi:hypothetical protein TCON_0297 [Astathelohania contejeani]|uniref:Uncharacterized protein n=1 Tax=Astathelohania contejeani TaxID=164912 RepID=A0ABQ7I264_9MICR|nr:hypothetical protein TCON_0297 [Thelohania contejeani]
MLILLVVFLNSAKPRSSDVPCSINPESTQIESVIEIGFTNKIGDKYILDPELLEFVRTKRKKQYFMDLHFDISKEGDVEIFRITHKNMVLCLDKEKKILHWQDNSKYKDNNCGFIFLLYPDNKRKMQSMGGGFITWENSIPSIKEDKSGVPETFLYDILVLPSPNALKQCLTLIREYEEYIGKSSEKSEGGGLKASFSPEANEHDEEECKNKSSEKEKNPKDNNKDDDKKPEPKENKKKDKSKEEKNADESLKTNKLMNLLGTTAKEAMKIHPAGNLASQAIEKLMDKKKRIK